MTEKNESTETRRSKPKWMKMRLDMMSDFRISSLLDLPNGAELFKVYMVLLLQSGYHNGALRYSEKRQYDDQEFASLCHVEKDKIKEIIEFLEYKDLLEKGEDGTLFFNETMKSIGSSSVSTERVRRFRERKRLKEKEDKGNNVSQKHETVSETLHETKCNGHIRYKKEDIREENINTPISPKGDEETKKEESLKQPMKPMPQPKADDQPAASGASGAKGFAEPSELESRRNAERPSPAEVVQAGHAISPRVPDDYLTTFINEMKNRDWTYIAAGKTCYVNKRNVQSVLYSFWSNEQKRRTEQAQKKMSHREAVEATQYQHGVYPVNYNFD